MNDLFASLQNSSVTAKAVAVTIGGLAGVFITLFIFWALIVVAQKFGKKE